MRLKQFLAFLSVLAIFILIQCCSLFKLGVFIAPKNNLPYQEPNAGIYVATNGNDSNIGNQRDNPVKSIPVAITNAMLLGLTNIYIQSGVYTPGNGLSASISGIIITNNSIALLGGCDAGFTSRSGFSELDGGGSLNHLIFIIGASNIVIDGLLFRNSYADGVGMHNCGGGIYISNSANGILQNSMFSNNQSTNFGGGVYIATSSNFNVSNVTFSSNIAPDAAAIFYIYSWNSLIQNCLINGNYSTNFGAGFYCYLSKNLTVRNCLILSNRVVRYGAGFFNNASSNIVLLNCSLNFNDAVNGASGYYSINSTNATIGGCYLTNNGDTNAVIVFNNNLPLLIITNNTIGGTNGTLGGAIRELTIDLVGHNIVNNIFISNTMQYLYYNIGGGTITPTSTWTNINDTNYTGAAMAYGNTVR